MANLEDLEKINTKNLYKYYESVLNSDIIDIFVNLFSFKGMFERYSSKFAP